MPQTEKRLPSLVGGVSQQPPSLRFPSQCEDALNLWLSLVDGATRRAPTDHIAEITNAADAFFHVIDRDADNRFLAVVTPEDVRVFDLDGTEIEVYEPDNPSPGPDFDTAYISDTPNNGLSSPENIGNGFWVTGIPNTVSTASTAEVGPLGIGTANKLSMSNGTNLGILEIESNTNWGPDALIASCYFKEDDSLDTITLRIRNLRTAQDYDCPFTWVASVLTAGSPTYGSATVESVGSGWYRASYRLAVGDDSALADPIQAGDGVEHFQLRLEDTVNPTGDFAWGAVLEADDDGSLTKASPYTRGFGDIRFLSIADSTFILNTSQTPRLGGAVSSAVQDEFLLFVRQITNKDGANSDDFSVTITLDNGDSTFTVATGTGTSTDSMAGSLQTAIAADADFDATVVGSTVHVTLSAAAVTAGRSLVAVNTSDPLGDLGLIGVYDTTAEFANLPLVAPDGFRVRVTGSAGEVSEDDDYYVKFVSNETGEFGKGRWEETVGPGLLPNFDVSRMPHQLIRRSDDEAGNVTGTPYQTYFTYGPATWVDREAGDDTTNPAPSFVGQEIQDLFFYQGRLGFLADQNVILSETAGFFSFWRTTVLAVPASDPIDVASNETQVSLLRNAVPLNETLFVFSDRAQFTLPGSPLTPDTAALEKVLSYESLDVKPVGLGRSVYFPFSNGQFSGVREILEVQEQTFDADETTQAIPKYIPGDITLAKGSSLASVLLFKGSNPGTLYAYKYAWQGNQKAQSAWSRWQFRGTVRDYSFVGQTLYVLIERASKLYLESMEIGDGLVDTGSEFRVHLDRRTAGSSPTYDAVNDETTITVPYDQAVQPKVVTRPGAVEQTVLSWTTTTVVVQGDLSATDVWIGDPFTSELTLSEPVIGSGQEAASGRFTPFTLQTTLAGTGAVKIQVTPDCGDTAEGSWDAQSVGLCDANVDAVTLIDGFITTGVMAPSEGLLVKYVMDTPLPARLIRATWEGDLTPYGISL